MNNEQRAEELIKKYGFEFDKIPKEEIVQLINDEVENFHQGSSEYIRLLCGYLYCTGDSSDAVLIDKAKHINFDVGCMIDSDWIESLKNGGNEAEYVNTREVIIEDFVTYYKNFKADDEW